jgi:hypothetical protein
MMHHALPRPPAPPPHYFDSAEALLRLQGEGRSLAEMARLTGLTIPQVTARLRLTTLDAGLRALLRREGVPEKIALTLVALPDPVTRRRLALRIIRERLCIRDAALLVASAGRRTPKRQEAPRQRVITVMRDVRPYRNAIRDIAEQMQTAGVRATFTERKSGGMLELTVSYPARRRRMERYHSI